MNKGKERRFASQVVFLASLARLTCVKRGRAVGEFGVRFVQERKEARLEEGAEPRAENGNVLDGHVCCFHGGLTHGWPVGAADGGHVVLHVGQDGSALCRGEDGGDRSPNEVAVLGNRVVQRQCGAWSCGGHREWLERSERWDGGGRDQVW